MNNLKTEWKPSTSAEDENARTDFSISDQIVTLETELAKLRLQKQRTSAPSRDSDDETHSEYDTGESSLRRNLLRYVKKREKP